MESRIIIDPAIQHGKPIVRGTRVPSIRLLGGLAGGMSVEDIVKEYDVTEEDVRAALAYASEVLEQEEHHPLIQTRTSERAEKDEGIHDLVFGVGDDGVRQQFLEHFGSQLSGHGLACAVDLGLSRPSLEEKL